MVDLGLPIIKKRDNSLRSILMFHLNGLYQQYLMTLRKIVNYSELYKFIARIFSKTYNLIETLGYNISRSAQNECLVKFCKVMIRKPDAPISGILDTVEVEVAING